MRLVEVARTRAHQVIQPCTTESYGSSWGEMVVNVTSGLEAKEIPADFFTLFSIIACVILVWIVILVVMVTCPPQLNSCSKNKVLIGRRRACVTPGKSRGYEKRFLFVDTSGRTRVVNKAARAVNEMYMSGGSTTSRSTTTSVSSKSSSRSSMNLPRSSETRETSEDTLVPLYDLIADNDKGSTNERLQGDVARASFSERQTNKLVRDPQPCRLYAKSQKDARQRQPTAKNRLLNNCKCQHNVLPLLRHKFCCDGDENGGLVYPERRESWLRDKTERRKCANGTSFPACQNESAPMDNAEDSLHFDITVGNTSRIYRLPSFSQSTIKTAESCDDDLVFNHSASQTPSIDTAPSSQSSWDKTRQRQLLHETFLCSSRNTPVQHGTTKTPKAPCSVSGGAPIIGQSPPAWASTGSSEIRSCPRTPINGTHHPEWDHHPMCLPHDGHGMNGFSSNYFGEFKSNRRESRGLIDRIPDYVNEVAQNTCAPYRSYQFIELDERGGAFSPREDVAMDLKPSDFFGLHCCTLPSHIRSRDRYHRETELVYDVPKPDAATSRNSRTSPIHEAARSSPGQRRSGFNLATDRNDNFYSGGAAIESLKIKRQDSQPVSFAAQLRPSTPRINTEAVTSAKLIRPTCCLRPGLPDEKEQRRSGNPTSELRPDANAQKVTLPCHGNSYDDEYVDMSQPLLRYYTVNCHKSNNVRIPNSLH